MCTRLRELATARATPLHVCCRSLRREYMCRLILTKEGVVGGKIISVRIVDLGRDSRFLPGELILSPPPWPLALSVTARRFCYLVLAVLVFLLSYFSRAYVFLGGGVMFCMS